MNSGDFLSDCRGKEFRFKKRERVLPGFLPSFKFKSFDSPDLSAWSADSFLSWFRAHGPCVKPVIASTFKEIFSSPLFSPPLEQLASSASQRGTVNPSFSQSPAAPPPPLQAPMANIPIDPAPFIPQWVRGAPD
jgi:hypothetical protein